VGGCGRPAGSWGFPGEGGGEASDREYTCTSDPYSSCVCVCVWGGGAAARLRCWCVSKESALSRKRSVLMHSLYAAHLCWRSAASCCCHVLHAELKGVETEEVRGCAAECRIFTHVGVAGGPQPTSLQNMGGSSRGITSWGSALMPVLQQTCARLCYTCNWEAQSSCGIGMGRGGS
jgi:hypothetical protein